MIKWVKSDSKKLSFFFQFKFLLDQGPFCGATDRPYFGLHMWCPPWALKPEWFSCLLSYLCVVNLSVISGAAPPFSINAGVHCVSVCTAGSPSRHPSCQQNRGGWDRNLGCWLDNRTCYPLGHAASSRDWHFLFSISEQLLPGQKKYWQFGCKF